MPVARSVAAHAVALAHPGVDGGAGGGGAGAIGPGSAGGGSGTPMDVVDGADDGAEADDGRVYCWCQMGSFGDMVACDDTECEREWVSLVSSRLVSTLFWLRDLLGSLTFGAQFHLGCIGLEVAPEGVWFCDACRNKPKNRRKVARAATSGGGSRRSNGNPRSSARAPSTT